jgi:1,2-diacylglycerol 3-beta-glucosyltransferase
MLPKVSVIIAARNEEKVIGSTLSHLTKVDYPKDKLEIFVVVDGSSDRTAEIARSFPDVKVIEQKEPRRCKAEALNAVIPLTTGEIIAVFDADAIVHPCAIRAAVKHFENEKVLAVTGLHESYKCNDWVSKASAFDESIRNFAVEFANKLNFDAILDGSNLYVRKRVLEALGLFDTETMVEDLALTINIITLKDREKIIYEPKAVVYQQEPNGVRNFYETKI